MDAMFVFVSARPVWRVETTPESVLTRHESVRIFPVAVARFAFVVAREERREEMLPSWAVLLPCNFWNAVRIESVAVTVPEPATNPVSSDVRFSLPEKLV